MDRTEQGDEPTKHAYTVPHSLRLVPPCTTPSAVLSTVHAFHRMYILSHGPSVEVPKYPMTDTYLSNLLPGPPVPFIEQAPDTSAAIAIDEFPSFHSDEAGCPCNTSSRRGASHGVNLDRFRWLRLILPNSTSPREGRLRSSKSIIPACPALRQPAEVCFLQT